LVEVESRNLGKIWIKKTPPCFGGGYKFGGGIKKDSPEIYF
jgi:hypothetical protein